MSAPDLNNRYALCCDLGIDRILVYALEPALSQLTAHSEAVLPPGSGPRHLAYAPGGSAVYTVNELNSTLTAFDYDGEAGTLAARQTLSILPEGASGASTAAEVLVHPSGKFIYSSNRGHDSLAIFGVDPAGQLSLSGRGWPEPVPQ